MPADQLTYRAEASASLAPHVNVVAAQGKLDLNLAIPPEMGGPETENTSPEDLFAACYAGSFIASLRLTAARSRLKLPHDTRVTVSISLRKARTLLSLDAEIRIQLPGLSRQDADFLSVAAYKLCPYRNVLGRSVNARLVVA
jgi:lipoyl-dependent peroxiredoxin